MAEGEVEPIQPIAPAAALFEHGPAGERHARGGPEATWGGGFVAAELAEGAVRWDAPVTLRGVVRGPTPFVAPHHERWGAYFWLVQPHDVVRVLLGPFRPGKPAGPGLRLLAGDVVEVRGYPVHAHHDQALLAAHLTRGADHVALLDDARRRLPGVVWPPADPS